MSSKKILYLQDMDQDSQIKLEDRFQAVIAPYDELTIFVSCHDAELAQPFNLSSTQQGVGNQIGYQYYGYLVDPLGNIQMPELGEMHVAGMTRLELQEDVTRRLRDGGYLEDPYVMVRFNNFKVFYLDNFGEKATVLNITDERCTLFEALAMVGDLNTYTRHDKIGVLREEGGKMTMRYLDPRSSQVFNDPYFMLQQNDVIITRPIKSRYFREEASYWMSWFSVLSSFTSIATLYFLMKNGYVVM
jgi:polysaccharide export outer membrane protein